MFIKAIPIDISFGEEALTYYIKDNQKKYINIGSVVLIPIKNKISYGIVADFLNEVDNENLEIKSIIEVLCTFPIINNYQIQLITELSSKYFLPIHKVLNLFMPKFILNRLEKNAFQDILDFENIPLIKNKQNTKPTFFHNINIKDIKKVLFENIGKLDDTVVIFPDDFFIDTFLINNPEYEKTAIIYKNSLTYSKKYKIYLDVLSKKKNILFGTRKILQYNLGAYKKLVYIEDSMVKYNYNQFEKYANIEIMKILIKNNTFEIFFVSSVPSIDFFYLSKISNFNYKTI